MIIRTELLREHSMPQAKKIAAYAIQSSGNFKELMNCFFSSKYRVVQRAAFVVGQAVKMNAAYIESYTTQLVELLQTDHVQEAQLRNTVRILQQLNIPENLHGVVINRCFQLVENPASAIAVKAFSLSILDKMASLYPDLQTELITVIETQWQNESAAFKSKGRKILKKFKKNN